MKCKIHPSERGAGVCASCLRERLLAVIAAEKRRNPDPDRSHPPPIFPQSVSPYADRHLRRSSLGFFSTPQVGPATADVGAVDGGRKSFSLISYLFSRRRSGGKEDSDPGHRRSSGSRSWLSAIVRRRRRKTPPFSPEIDWPRRARNRGMSPAIDGSDLGSESGCGSSAPSWMPTPSPMRRAAANYRHGGGIAISSFGVCLSPLVRTSPAPRRGRTPEVGFSGDLRHHGSGFSGDLRHHGGGGAVPLANRSRKLADFGRPR